jgi:capsular polysaccharide biosynthesis protein
MEKNSENNQPIDPYQGLPIPSEANISECFDVIKAKVEKVDVLTEGKIVQKYLRECLCYADAHNRVDIRYYLFLQLLNSGEIEIAIEEGETILADSLTPTYLDTHIRQLLSVRLSHLGEYQRALAMLCPAFIRMPTVTNAHAIYWYSRALVLKEGRSAPPHEKYDFYQFAYNQCRQFVSEDLLNQFPSEKSMSHHQFQKCKIATLPQLQMKVDKPKELNRSHYVMKNRDTNQTIPEITVHQFCDASIEANEWSISIYANAEQFVPILSSRKTTQLSRLEKQIYQPGLSALIADYSVRSNYCHWMLDVLPRIYYMRMAQSEPIIKWIVGDMDKKYQIDTLGALGIPSSDVIPLIQNTHIKCEELLCCSDISFTRSHPTRNAWREPLHLMKNQIFDWAGITSQQSTERIYISRSDSGPRKVYGEEEFAARLESQFGFISYRLSELTLEEQVRLFSNAEIVIGAHGAGLTNIIFCKQNTKIVEVLNPAYGTAAYGQVALSLNLNYHYVCGESANNENAYHRADLGHQDFLISEHTSDVVFRYLNSI